MRPGYLDPFTLHLLAHWERCHITVDRDSEVFDRLLSLLQRCYTSAGEQKMAKLIEVPLDLPGL